MKKNVKKLLLLIAVVITAVVCFTFSASALDATGKIGDNVTYSYNNQTKQLVISGSGKMWDYYNYDSPFYKSDIKEVVIENGVTSISYFAFYNCQRLTDIIIPETVSSIGSFSFYGCQSLTDIVIPDGVKSLDEYVFAGCKSIKSLIIPDSVTSIGKYAFGNCTSLTSITIPDSVTSIGTYAFNNCTSLTSVTIPNSVTSIGSSAFYNCTSLTSITIPDSVLSTGLEIFKFCYNLTDVHYSGTHRQWRDLFGDESLSNVMIHYSPDCIDTNDDKLCDKCYLYVEEIYTTGECGDDVKYTVYKDGMVIVYGSGNVGYFSDLSKNSISILADISEVKNVIIEDGITGISNNAFLPTPSNAGDTIPESVTIPKSVTSIGGQALSSIIVYYQGSAEDWAKTNCKSYKEIHFNGCKGDFTLSSTKAPTCTKNGTKTYTCPCSVIRTETVKALGHKYSSSYTTDKKATCTKAGSKSQHCTRNGCTAKKNVKSISALGHSYGAYKTTKKATPSVNGTKVKTCSACSAKYTATIYKPSSFKLSAISYTYNGKAKKPTVTVKDSKGSTLKNGTDYKVTYSANTAIGTAKATVTLMGNYSGSKVLTFKIILGATDKIKATQTASTVKLSWNKVAGAKGYKIYVYDSKGELQLTKSTTKTSITVDDLSKGTKYKFTVKAYAVVSKKTVWSEKTKSLTTATKPGQPTLKATAGKGKVSLSWTKQNGSNGYVVYMATSKKSDYKKIATLEGVANLKMTKSKLKKGKKYYFKVRAYKTVGSTKVYGAWSSVKSVKVK